MFMFSDKCLEELTIIAYLSCSIVVRNVLGCILSPIVFASNNLLKHSVTKLMFSQHTTMINKSSQRFLGD